MLSFFTGGKSENETTKTNSETLPTATNTATIIPTTNTATTANATSNNDVLKKANVLINKIQKNQNNALDLNQNKVPKNLDFRQFEKSNNPMIRNIFKPGTNNTTSNTNSPNNKIQTNVKPNRSANNNGDNSNKSKLPRSISTFQPSNASRSNSNSIRPNTMRPNTMRPNVSNMRQNLLPMNESKTSMPRGSLTRSTPNIGTITLHMKRFRFENKEQMKGGSRTIKHLIRFASGKHPPKFNKTFAPQGHPKMSDEQMAFMLLSLLRVMNPSGFSELTGAITGKSMSKPKGISFKNSPVHVNIDLKSSHNTRNTNSRNTNSRNNSRNTRNNSRNNTRNNNTRNNNTRNNNSRNNSRSNNLNNRSSIYSPRKSPNFVLSKPMNLY